MGSDSHASDGLWENRRGERLESFAVFTVQDRHNFWQQLILERWAWETSRDGCFSLEVLAHMPVMIKCFSHY